MNCSPTSTRWLVHTVVGIDQAPRWRGMPAARDPARGRQRRSRAAGSYMTTPRRAWVHSAKTPDDRVALELTIPANSTPEVRVPTSGKRVGAPARVAVSRLASFGGIQYAMVDAGLGIDHFKNPEDP